MANVVQIVIQLENNQAVAGIDQLNAKVVSVGSTGAQTGQQFGAAMDGMADKVGSTTQAASALDAQMRQMGVSSAAAAAGIAGIGNAAAETARRVATASGEMQQMMENIQAAQQKYAAMKPSAAPATRPAYNSNTLGNAFVLSNSSRPEAEMARLGEAFERMPAYVAPASQAVENFGGHSRSALDSVRLFAQTLGIRIPRAMESMLSRMPAVSSALSGMVQGFFLLGAVEIFARLGQGAYEFGKQIFDVNAAMRDYLKTTGQAASQKLFDDASLETAVGLMKEANEQVDALEKKRHAAGADRPGGGFSQYLNVFVPSDETGQTGATTNTPSPFSADNGRQLAEAAANSAQAILRSNTLRRQGEEERLRNTFRNQEASLESVARVSVAQQNAAALNKKIQEDNLARETDLHNVAVTSRALQIKMMNEPEGYVPTAAEEKKLTQVHPVAQNAGVSDRDAADLNAHQQAAAELTRISRSERDQRIAAQNEAISAGLEGEARYAAQRQQAIDAITRKALDGAMTVRTADALTGSLEEKFDNERADRLEKQFQDAQKLMREASQAGLTGAGRIVADHNNRIGEINTDRTLDPNAAAQMRVAAQMEANQKLSALQSEYTDRVKAEIDSRTSAALEGYAKIAAEQHRLHDESDKRFTDSYGGADVPATFKAQGEAQHQAELTSIDRASGAERQKLAGDIQQKTLDLNKQAAEAERRVHASGLGAWVDDYRNSMAEIQDAHTEMLAKIDSEQRKTGGDPGQYEQQKVDADRIANAQIVEANAQMRHELAGNLESAFSDPVRFIQQKMKQMFAEMIADWLMQSQVFKNAFSGTLGAIHPTHAGTGGAVSSTINAATTLGVGASSGGGTVDQSYAVPGAAGTAYSVDASGVSSSSGISLPASVGASSGGSAVTPGGALSLATTGIGAAHALGINASSASTDPWDDPSQTSSSDTTQAGSGVQGSGSSSTLSAQGFAAAGLGAYTGTRGIIGAFESGKPSGIFTGAESGAAMGASIGSLFGPEGTVIGAGVGATSGATAGLVGWASGEGSHMQGQKYYRDTIRPQMEQIETTYMKGGGGDAVSTIGQLNQAASSGFDTLIAKIGTDGATWTRDTYITKELNALTGDVNRLALGGRDYTSRSAAQFHDGGLIGGFGSFATSSDEGFIHAQAGEVMMSRADSLEHAPLLNAIGSGATPSDLAAQYMRQSDGSGGGGVTHNHNYGDTSISAIDAESFEGFMKRTGAPIVSKTLNGYQDTYAGDAAYG